MTPEEKARLAEIERNEARDQLAAAVCVLKSIGVKFVAGYYDREMNLDICPVLIPDGETTSDEALAAFAVVAPMLEGGSK